MRIALLVHKLTGGGAERVAAMWANGFRDRGHEVQVVVFDADSQQQYALTDSILLTTVALQRRNRAARVVERIVKVWRVLRDSRPDVVIDVMPGWQRLVAMMGVRCRKIATEHNSFERPKNAKHKLNPIKKYWLNQLYDHVTVLTQADKEVIGQRLKHVTVLPNPLALEPVDSVPQKEKIVLAVGRKDAWHYKGFDVLIKAWAQVSHDAFGWKLRIVGGSDRGGQEFLEHLCEEYGVTGSVDLPDYQSDIQAYYRQAAVFVLSSRYEGFGLVLIEAMSQGCACIACDYKGRQSEIVTNGVDGMTCEPDNVGALATTIKVLIANEEMRAWLQVNAIRRSKDFSLNHIMNRWEDIFKK